MTAAMAALSLALATVVGALVWKDQFTSAPPTTGIAVLPFESLSRDKDNTFFADGIYDGVSKQTGQD